MVPFGLSPNVRTLLPSGRTVSFETSVQLPTRSLAVCAAPGAGREIPKQSAAIVLRASVVRRFIVFPFVCQKDCDVRYTDCANVPKTEAGGTRDTHLSSIF